MWQKNIDHNWHAMHNHTWHVCQHCDHKFKSEETPLPNDIQLTAEYLEAAGKMEEVMEKWKEAG